ncbi:eukaryotic translation initiation factor 3 subunit K-like [Tubulanus polymorphus]|uniref:eukaryotic translation initiation factor 3 subunit K-like n=1 Tax=Tubulanus polymorphus TaxID=672921 RepID=UPI003DA29861
MAEQMRGHVAALLRGIDRYNPENLATLERYVDLQCKDKTYDLEANLAVLKLYQFNPSHFQTSVASQILLKALTNMPHTDFTLCKCLIDIIRLKEEPLIRIVELHDLLETCQFREFWNALHEYPDLIMGISAFEDSIRKFVCHVISITYQSISQTNLQVLLGYVSETETQQWVQKYGWREEGDLVFVTNQDDNIKTKNITENITFESVSEVMKMGWPTRSKYPMPAPQPPAYAST